jgi:acyl-CoA synthetase (AMP-forming)/AMP-acid ligase II/acyl carrier protein
MGHVQLIHASLPTVDKGTYLSAHSAMDSYSEGPHQVERSEYSSLVQLVRSRALRQPHARAFTFLANGEVEESTLTYQELDRQARSVAVSLHQLGISYGARVVICLPPGLEYVIAFFGCMYAGAIPAPCYPPDQMRPNRTVPRLNAILEDAKPMVIITTASDQPATRSLLSSCSGNRAIQWLIIEQAVSAPADEWEARRPGKSTTAILMYTSGSTDSPKGVMVSHANVLHNLAAFQGFEGRTCGTFVSWLPLFHDLGLFLGVLHPIYRCLPSVLMPATSFAERPIRWLETMSHYEASTTGGPNWAYDICLLKTNREQRENLNLRSWSLALNGAEPVRAETLHRFSEAFAPSGFRRDAFYPSYGLAEGTATVSGGRAPGPPIIRAVRRKSLERGNVTIAPAEEEDLLPVVGCGETLPGQEIVIVDPTSLTPCASTDVGEIWVSGPSIAHEYWNRSKESALTFGACLGKPDGRPFLRTGDLGFLYGRELFIVGRLKDVIVLEGRNYYAEDIEPTVAQCDRSLRPGCGAAFAADIAGREQLIIVHEVKVTPDFNGETVIRNIRRAVTDRHGITASAVVLIKPGTLPKTSSGKIRRRTCRQDFLAGSLHIVYEWRRSSAPKKGEPSSPFTHARLNMPDPWDRAEAEVAIRAWLVGYLSHHLEIEPSAINLREPFARYDLSSLEAVSLVEELERWLRRRLQPTLIWEYPSIEQLARHLAC